LIRSALVSLVESLQHRLSGERMVRHFRRWRTRDRAWVGRCVKLLGTVRVEECRFDVSSPLISDELKCRVFYGRYERTERELLRRHLPVGAPVVELGGGMGLVACIVNSRLEHPERHVVVEANPKMIPLIERNRALNGSAFAVVHAAIGYAGAHVAVESGEDLLASRTRTATGGGVRAIQLHEILDRHAFGSCTLICDIEGAEIELVENELETLRSRVGLIVLEEHPEYCAEPVRAGMLKLLANAGFESIDALRKVHVFRNTRRRH
jgi:FkbM family methyltransferase